MLNHALKYAELGWHVFPLAPGQKTPLTSHGVKDATTDEYEIRHFWGRWPKANIGLACGAKSGVYVIDVDYDEEKGINGYESLKQLGEMPATVCQRTPRGGSHFLFTTENPPPNKNGLRPGIDIRGDGYYVVLAPSVHPNGGTYSWVDGHAPGEIQLAEYPDFMRVERERAPAVPVDDVRRDVCARNTPPDTGDMLLRARSYFERVEPAVQGNRGHDCLMWAAQCCVHGLRMSDEEAYSFLATEYNPRCVPPWDLSQPKDEKDFRRKIAEARKNPPRKFANGWILDDPEYAEPAGPPVEIDRAALIADTEATDAPAIQTASKTEPTTIPAEYRNQTGWIGEYIGYCENNAPHPNWPLSYAGALALASAVTGRKIVGPGGIATNLYALGLALPGTGKDFTRKLNAQILAEAGALDMYIDRIASAEGLEDRLSESPAVLFQPDEADSMMFSVETRDGRSVAINSFLNQVYTSSTSVIPRRVRASSNEQAKSEPIIRPHVAMLATSVPKLFYEAIGSRSLAGGFLARTLPIEADQRSDLRFDAPQEIPRRLIEWVQYFVDFIPPGSGNVESITEQTVDSVYTVAASDCGKRALKRCAEQIDQGYRQAEAAGDAVAAAMWSRAYEQAVKIATLDALSDNPECPSVTGKMVGRAYGVATFVLRRSLSLTLDYSGTSDFERKCNAIVKLIRDRGGIVRERDVYRKLKISRADMDRYLESLVLQEIVGRGVKGGKQGPPTKVCWLLND